MSENKPKVCGDLVQVFPTEVMWDMKNQNHYTIKFASGLELAVKVVGVINEADPPEARGTKLNEDRTCPDCMANDGVCVSIEVINGDEDGIEVQCPRCLKSGWIFHK